MASWRSELAVPGSNARMIEKGLASAADAIFLDLEDAVAPGEKAAARGAVAQQIRDGTWGAKVRAFRMNALDTPWFIGDLTEVVTAAGDSLERIVVPKVNRPEDVYVIETILRQIETPERARPIELEVQIESAEGLVNCERIAASSPRISALTFGPGDFAASAGMPAAVIGTPDSWDARYPGHRWHYAMSRIVIAARAAGVRAIDGPYGDFRDLEGLRRSCEIARALGFDGKWCIHPSQIEIVNEVFSPSEAEVAWARRVLQAAAAAANAGQGAASVDGKMIDGASIRIARRVTSDAELSL